MSGTEDAKPPSDPGRAWRLRLYGMAFGLLLALLCRCLPPDYRSLCETVANLCSP